MATAMGKQAFPSAPHGASAVFSLAHGEPRHSISKQLRTSRSDCHERPEAYEKRHVFVKCLTGRKRQLPGVGRPFAGEALAGGYSRPGFRCHCIPRLRRPMCSSRSCVP